MEQPIKPKRRYRYTVRPSPRVEKIDAKTFPSKFEGERKSGSKINFLGEKGTSNRELDRFLVTRLYRATRESSCTSVQWTIGLQKKGVLQALRCLVGARCVRRCRGRACASLRPAGRGEGEDGKGGGYAAAALERRVAPGKRMRGRLHDPASAHATSSPANSRDNLLPPRIESCVPPSLSRFHSSFLE